MPHDTRPVSDPTRFFSGFGRARISETRILFRPKFSVYVLAAMFIAFACLGIVLASTNVRPEGKPDDTVTGLLFELPCFTIAYWLMAGRLWLDERGIHAFNGFRTRSIPWGKFGHIDKQPSGKGFTVYVLYMQGKPHIRIRDSFFRIHDFLELVGSGAGFASSKLRAERKRAALIA